MRVVLIGVSHWHTPFFLDPCLELPGVSIVGVCDPDLARTEAAASKAGCKAFTDYREMCSELKPDFAFALAQHCDMAELARFLIAERIAVRDGKALRDQCLGSCRHRDASRRRRGYSRRSRM